MTKQPVVGTNASAMLTIERWIACRKRRRNAPFTAVVCIPIIDMQGGLSETATERIHSGDADPSVTEAQLWILKRDRRDILR
jgi:hypothetical protein